MRRCWLIAILLLVVGCSKDIDFEPSQDQAQNRILSGIIADEKDEDNESRVYLDNKIRIRWNKGDLISVFDGTTRNKEFVFLGSDGSSAGDFSDNSAGTIGTGNAIDRLYGLYPYASNTEYCYGEDESEADYLRYTLPATQTYKPNSIGLNANLMVAATANKSDKTLVFRNVCSYLRLKLYGADQTVSSIVFKGNTDEVLSGDVAITATYGKAPTIKMLGAAEEDNKTITLDCSEGVTVGSTSDEATEFWLVVPPLNFPNGFTITVKGEGNMGQEIVINNNLTFARNTYNTITREVSMEELSTTTIPDNEIWYTSSDGSVVTPNQSNAFGDAKIVSNVYENGQGIITFDKPITQIGMKAFLDCTSLTSITLPECVTQIGTSAFSSCTSLTSITLPESVTQIGTSAFLSCRSLTSITLPAGITQIGNYAFSYCTSLTSITLPEGITQIGDFAFSDCTSLTSITLPESLTQIGSNPFVGCDALSKFDGKFASADGRYLIDDGVLLAFAPSGLTEYTIPEGVTQIGLSAFYECTSLTSITLPESLTQIGHNAFSGCTSLTSITLPESLTQIGGDAFFNCISLTSITLPAGITQIGNYAFYYCTSLTSITLPAGITQIGNYAFYYCTSLIEVYCKPTTPPAGGNKMFDNNVPGRKIYVPVGSGEAYKTAQYWSAYASIIEEMGSETPPDNEIWYTATAKVVPNKVDTYYWPSYYSIESNEWDETTGNGVIRFRDKVTSIGGHAFSDHSEIKSITLPNTITYIGDYAFEDCSNLKSITIPDNVTNIGIRAFKDCIRLEQFNGKLASADGNSLIVNGVLNSFAPVGVTEYTIPENVTEIGVWVFNSCSKLTSITIPNSVTKIGNGAFAYCSGLTSLTIPNSVTEIGDEVFWSCTKLDGIYINNPTPPTVGENMLSYNMEKVKIYVPADYIDAYLASSCWQDYADHLVAYDFEKGEVVPISFNTISYTATEKVTPYKTDVFGAAIVSNEWDSATGNGVIKFDRNVTSFGDYAFYNCRNLTGITIPNSVAEIGVRAFGDCRNLESITIGNFVTKIGDSAFVYCTNLKSITIPDSIEEIGAGAFRECSKLESITIPNSVAKIGEYAFYYCRSLTEITIPNSVTSIGEYAFAWCSSLTSINIPNGVTSIKDYAFKACESLESITVPNSVAEIGNYAFDGCSSLKSTTIGTGITTIGEWAFLGCTGELFVNSNIPKNAFYQSDFTKVTIGNGVTTIGEGAFIICHSLMSIEIPNSVTEIGKEAFYYCDKLASISIPNSVTKIGESAFIYCSGLENVTIGSGVTKIGVAVFKECTGLASITIPNNVTEVGNYAFYGCTGLTSITIPNSVTTIGSSAFRSCSNLENVTIGNIVTKVGDYAFEDCGSLTEITIPNSVTSIGYAAFRGCSNLKSAYCRPATPPTIGSFAFDSNASDRKIYVPEESFYTYRSKWSSYSSAIESYKFD